MRWESLYNLNIYDQGWVLISFYDTRKGILCIFKRHSYLTCKSMRIIVQRSNWNCQDFVFIKIIYNIEIVFKHSIILYIPEIMFEFLEKTVTNDEEWWKHMYWMRLSSRERLDYYWHSCNAWLKLNILSQGYQ